MGINKDLDRVNGILEEITEEQMILSRKIETLKGRKLDVIKKELIDTNLSNKSDEIIKHITKLTDVIYGDKSVTKITEDAQQVVRKCLKNWVSKRFITNIPFKKEYGNRNWYYGLNNRNIVVNRRGFGYLPEYCERTVYTDDIKTISSLITNEPRLKNYIFKQDKKQIYEIFRKYLPKISFESQEDNKFNISGLNINIIDEKTDSNFGISSIGLITKDRIEIRGSGWQGWILEISDSKKRWDSTRKSIELKKGITKEDEIIISQIPNTAIEEIKKYVDNLEKENKENWKHWEKMRRELEPYLFAYEI